MMFLFSCKIYCTFWQSLYFIKLFCSVWTLTRQKIAINWRIYTFTLLQHVLQNWNARFWIPSVTSWRWKFASQVQASSPPANIYHKKLNITWMNLLMDPSFVCRWTFWISIIHIFPWWIPTMKDSVVSPEVINCCIEFF